jgi:dolichyl-phosphate-mannose-protein mannosyltransferase
MTADAPSARGAASRWIPWPPALALAALTAWIVLAVTGGFSWRVGRIVLSAHDPRLALAIAAAAAAVCAAPPVRRVLPHVVSSWWPALTRVSSRVALAASIATLYAGIHWGSFVAGGADSYGYVSQAHLWARGELRVFQPIALMVSWPESDWTFSPLGYRPGRRSGFIVPTYSPGLPLLMAGALKTAGTTGMFLVVPILGALTTWLTFLVGRRVHSALTGAIAAILFATSPIVLYQLVQPMSDIPVTAWWTAAVVFALRRDRAGAVLSGLAASAALLTRPNLLPLAVPLGAYVLFAPGSDGTWSRRGSRAALFALALVPAVLSIAKINSLLYGSPVSSGYGRLTDIYAFDNVFANTRRYSRWVIESQTWFVAAAAAAPAVAWTWRPAARQAALRLADTLLFVSFAAVLFACYAFYLVFSDWTYIRFLLPALPLVLVLATALALEAIALLPLSGRSAVLVLLTALLASCYIVKARDRKAFDFASIDSHYVDVARYVDQALPARAVLLAVQESGSLRYYANRLTLRWDMIDPARLDSALEELRQKGYPPYFVLETWEEASFRRRFAGYSELGSLEWPPLADVGRSVRVRIYDPSSLVRYRAGEEIRTDRVMEPER